MMKIWSAVFQPIISIQKPRTRMGDAIRNLSYITIPVQTIDMLLLDRLNRTSRDLSRNMGLPHVVKPDKSTGHQRSSRR